MQWKYNSYLVVVLFILSACSPEMRKQLDPVPNSYGPTNQIVVVADTDLWQSAIGDTFRYYFSSAYPILPAPEPIFDLKHFSPSELNADPLRKQLRNYIFLANLEDASSSATKMLEEDLGTEKFRKAREDANYSTNAGEDKWAHNQLVIYLFSYGQQELTRQIIRAFPAIKKRVDKANWNKVDATVYLDGENRKAATTLRTDMSVTMRVPGDYDVVLNEENTIWLRRETDESSTNILLHKQPYERKAQLTKAHLKAVRDSLGRRYVSSRVPGTYMQINDIDLPMLSEVKSIGGNYAVEARGIWELVNDYMGGPFVSYVTVNPTTNELLFVDGFVHAPGRKKREYMQGLEHIIQTIKF
ncbi:MAG: DUF4837 family protein [Bacteroidota bacterium]